MVDAVPAPRTRTGIGVNALQGCDNLASGFFRSAERWADRPALVVGDQRLTYRQLAAKASTVASTISRYAPDAHPLAAILASRSVTAYAGILGILASGRGYVPLNPGFPVERTRKMLRASGASLLVVDEASLAALPKLLRDIESAVTVIAPDVANRSGLPSALPWHRFVGAERLSSGLEFIFSPYGQREAVAYL